MLMYDEPRSYLNTILIRHYNCEDAALHMTFPNIHNLWDSSSWCRSRRDLFCPTLPKLLSRVESERTVLVPSKLSAPGEGRSGLGRKRGVVGGNTALLSSRNSSQDRTFPRTCRLTSSFSYDMKFPQYLKLSPYRSHLSSQNCAA